MGLKEDLIVDWTDKVIEYQERQFYILKQFQHGNKEYLYGVEKDTIGSEKMNAVFLYKIKDSIFEHVEDDKLFEELLVVVSGLLTAQMVEKDIKEHKDSLK